MPLDCGTSHGSSNMWRGIYTVTSRVLSIFLSETTITDIVAVYSGSYR